MSEFLTRQTFLFVELFARVLPFFFELVGNSEILPIDWIKCTLNNNSGQKILDHVTSLIIKTNQNFVSKMSGKPLNTSSGECFDICCVLFWTPLTRTFLKKFWNRSPNWWRSKFIDCWTTRLVVFNKPVPFNQFVFFFMECRTNFASRYQFDRQTCPFWQRKNSGKSRSRGNINLKKIQFFCSFRCSIHKSLFNPSFLRKVLVHMVTLKLLTMSPNIAKPNS